MPYSGVSNSRDSSANPVAGRVPKHAALASKRALHQPNRAECNALRIEIRPLAQKSLIDHRPDLSS